MLLSAKLFRAAFVALAEEKDDMEIEEDDPLVEALANFSDEVIIAFGYFFIYI